ncbi:MAG: hypothetical protein IIY72_05140, partial [Solobacterium sp.]|nr:hypothetical protein [Solobacterium sp.]
VGEKRKTICSKRKVIDIKGINHVVRILSPTLFGKYPPDAQKLVIIFKKPGHGSDPVFITL